MNILAKNAFNLYIGGGGTYGNAEVIHICSCLQYPRQLGRDTHAELTYVGQVLLGSSHKASLTHMRVHG